MAHHIIAPRPSLPRRRHSHGHGFDAPAPAYKPDLYASGYTPAVLPWNPYQRSQTPHPGMQPRPQLDGYGYFSWPSTSTVDSLSESMELPKGGSKLKKGGLFSSLRRKSHGPDGHLHRLLLDSRPGPIIWDVRNSTATACLATAPPTPLSYADRSQHATSNHQEFMRITCDLMPWSIDVRNDNGGVTVGDVLDAIGASMQRRVRRSEWLIAQESLQEKVIRAFAWRCYSAQGPPGYEEQQGPKRVDWLLKKTMFRGLSRGSEEHTWQLHLGSH